MNGNHMEERIYLSTYCPAEHHVHLPEVSERKVGMVAAGICHL